MRFLSEFISQAVAQRHGDCFCRRRLRVEFTQPTGCARQVSAWIESAQLADLATVRMGVPGSEAKRKAKQADCRIREGRMT